LREQLIDMTHQLSPLFKKARIVATEDGTRIEAHDDDKILLVVANLKQPIPGLKGEFGIVNLATFDKLLAVPSFKHDDAQLVLHYNDDLGHLSEFEFRDVRSRNNMKFKTMNPRLVPSVKLTDIPWHVTVTPSKSNIAEFTHLAGILSDCPTFGVKVEHDTLFATIGIGSTSTHSAEVALANDVTTPFTAPASTWNTKHLLAILRNAPGPNPAEVRFSERGLAGITVETEHGSYNYILRAKPV
jgi:hypothetical protein